MIHKILLTLATQLTALSTAWAYPAIGDKVSWTGSVNDHTGQTTDIKITKEVIAHDNAKNLWTVKVEASFGEKKTSETVFLRDLYTPEEFKRLLAECKKNGGHLEKLTAPAGVYDTCKMSTILEDGTLVERWWGDIPFGVVSKSTRNSNTQIPNPPDLNSVVAGL